MASQNISIVITLDDQVSNKLTSVTNNLDKLNEATKKVALSASAAFIGLSKVLIDSANNFSTVETEATRAIDNAHDSMSRLEEVTGVLIKNSPKFISSLADQAKLLAYMTGGTVDLDEALATYGDTLKYAEANQMDWQTAAVMSSSIMTIFKQDTEETIKTLNLLSRANQIGYNTGTQLADAFQMVAGAAANLNWNTEDLIATLTALGDVGYIGTEAGTALKRSLNSLSSPSKSCQEALDALGISNSDLSETLQDSSKFFNLFESKLNDIKDPLVKATYASDLFGQGAGPAMSALLGIGAGALDEYKEMLQNVDGELDRIHANLMSAQSFTDLFKKAIEQLSTALGEANKESLAKFAEVLSPIIEKITDFIINNKELVSGIFLATTAIIGLVAVMAVASIVIGAISTPVLIAVGVLGALAAAIYFTYKAWNENWGGIQEKVMAVWTKVEPIFTRLEEALIQFGEQIKSKLEPIMEKFKETGEKLKATMLKLQPIFEVIAIIVGGALAVALSVVLGIINSLAGALEGIMGIIGGFIEAIGGLADIIVGLFTFDPELILQGFTSIFQGIFNIIQGWQETIMGFLGGFIDGFIGFWISLFGGAQTEIEHGAFNISDKLAQLWTSITEGIAIAWGNIKIFFAAIPESLALWIESVITWFATLPLRILEQLMFILGYITQTGINIWNYLSTNVPLWITSVVAWFSELPGKIWTWLVNLYQKFITWGKNTWEYLVANIPLWIGNLVNWFKELPGKIWESLVTLKDKIKDSFVNAWNTLIGEISNWPGKLLDWGKNIAQSFVQGIKDGLRSLADAFKNGMDAAKGNIQGNSPPKEGPYKEIDIWGFNIGTAWVEGMREAIFGFKLPDSGTLDLGTTTPNASSSQNTYNETTNSPVINIYYQGSGNNEVDAKSMARQFAYAISSGMY